MAGRWPADMIDGEQLYEMLGYESDNPEVIGEAAYAQLLDFETAVDDAHLKGRIKRFTAKDPTTGAVVAHGFKRADIQAIVRGGPWTRSPKVEPAPEQAASATPTSAAPQANAPRPASATPQANAPRPPSAAPQANAPRPPST